MYNFITRSEVIYQIFGCYVSGCGCSMMYYYEYQMENYFIIQIILYATFYRLNILVQHD